MKLTSRLKLFALLPAFAVMAAAPLKGSAQTLSEQSHHRQQKKNEWRNLAIGSGALGLLGLAKGNSTLAAIGIGGALYSANRYEQDRRSQSRTDRQRAALYHRSRFSHNGHTYVRRTVYKHGHKYYRFVRAD